MVAVRRTSGFSHLALVAFSLSSCSATQRLAGFNSAASCEPPLPLPVRQPHLEQQDAAITEYGDLLSLLQRDSPVVHSVPERELQHIAQASAIAAGVPFVANLRVPMTKPSVEPERLHMNASDSTISATIGTATATAPEASPPRADMLDHGKADDYSYDDGWENISRTDEEPSGGSGASIARQLDMVASDQRALRFANYGMDFKAVALVVLMSFSVVGTWFLFHRLSSKQVVRHTKRRSRASSDEILQEAHDMFLVHDAVFEDCSRLKGGDGDCVIC